MTMTIGIEKNILDLFVTLAILATLATLVIYVLRSKSMVTYHNHGKLKTRVSFYPLDTASHILKIYYKDGQIKSESHYRHGKFHKRNGYAYKSWYPDGAEKEESCYLNGKLHSENRHAYIKRYKREKGENTLNGTMEQVLYYKHGKLHHPNGVASKEWYRNRQEKERRYFKDGKLHNENGYALQSWYKNGQIMLESNYLNGKRETFNGVSWNEWYKNGQMKSKSYWIDGELHNQHGFAFQEWTKDGQVTSEEYWLRGDRYSKDYLMNSERHINLAEVDISSIDPEQFKIVRYLNLSDVDLSNIELDWNIMKKHFPNQNNFDGKVVEVDGTKYQLKTI